MADQTSALGKRSVAVGGAVTSSTFITGNVHIHQRLLSGAPFQAPPLPEYFIQRPEISERLKARLLTGATTVSGALAITVIHGLGGIGKSDLASALAHDEEVRVHFPDGVLWAKLGQKPDLSSALRGWIQALGDYDFQPTTPETASAHLRSSLYSRAILLVVDDAWDPAYVSFFRVGGPRCHLLITTRRADIADQAGAERYELGAMTPQQSLALLSNWLARPLQEAEQDAALRLARAVGHLPLALELAVARLRRGRSWSDLVAALEREVPYLEALEGPHRRNQAASGLEKAFGLSLNALRADDAPAWQAFAWLGVVPENVALNALMAATLWNVDRPEASDVLEVLWNDALLLFGSQAFIGPNKWQTYRLHDLMHDMACRLLTAEPPDGLGFSLSEARRQLLQRYRLQTRDGLWHTLPDDGYIHSHLAWHMEQAGQTDEFYALLREETAEGRNGWYETRETLGQMDGYMKDLKHAWQLSEEEYTGHQTSRAIGLQCRYALINASLNSLTANFPPELVLALVEREMWTPVQALSYARRMLDPKRRTKTLRELVSRLPTEYRELALWEGLAAAWELPELEHNQTLEEISPRMEAILAFAPHLSGDRRTETLRDSLEAARNLPVGKIGLFTKGSLRVEALARLASHMPVAERPQVLREAWSTAKTVEDEDLQSHLLSQLIPLFPEEKQVREHLEEALRLARAMPFEPNTAWLGHTRSPRVSALLRLVPYLSGEERTQVLQEALELARAIENDKQRTWILAGLIEYLEEPQRGQVLQEVLVLAQKLQNAGHRGWVLRSLSPPLSEPQRSKVIRQALAAIREIEDPETRAMHLQDLIPLISVSAQAESLLQEGLAAARAIEYLDDRAETLAHLSLHFPEPVRQRILGEALEAAQNVRGQNDYGCVKTLTSIAPYLPESQRGRALEEARDVAYSVRGDSDRDESVARVVIQMAELGYLRQAIATWQEIETPSERDDALAHLAACLAKGENTEPLLQKVLAKTRAIEDEDLQARALETFVAQLAELGQPERALALVGRLTSEHGQGWALRQLGPRLGATEKAQELLQNALAIEYEHFRAQTLAELAPHLPESLLLQALEATQMFKQDEHRAQALMRLVPRLAELGHAKQALEMALSVENKRWRAEILADLLPHLPEQEREQAQQEGLVASQSIEDVAHQAWAQAKLATYLREPEKSQMYREVLGLLPAVRTGEDQADILASMAPHLPDPLLRDALATVQEIEEEKYQVWTLGEFVPHCAVSESGQILLQEIVEAVREVEEERYQAWLLAKVAPYLSGSLLQEAVRLAQAIMQTRYRVYALARLASHMPVLQRDQLLLESLSIARSIDDAYDRTKALTYLMPHLLEQESRQVLQEARVAARTVEKPTDRVEVFAELADHLPASESSEVLLEALHVAEAIKFSRSRGETLTKLAHHLAKLPAATLYPLWREILHARETHMRPDLLSDLTALSPAIAKLGGEEALIETFQAVRDVGRWWP